MSFKSNLRRYDNPIARLIWTLSTKAPQDINAYITMISRRCFQDGLDGKGAELPSKGTVKCGAGFFARTLMEDSPGRQDSPKWTRYWIKQR